MRSFNVFVDNEFFNVEVDPTGDYVPVAVPVAAPVAAAPVARPAAAAAKPAAVAPAQQAKPAAPAASEAADGSGTPLKAPMPGLIIRYLKQVGDAVKKGEGVVVLEAMKMENALVAPCDGVVKAVKFASGDNVAKGATLVLIE